MQSKEGVPIVEGVNAQVCNVCGELKPYSDFTRIKGCKDGREGTCKACTRKRSRRWAINNREQYRRNMRSANLKRNYGLTVEEYEEILRAQDNRCALCGSDEPGGTRVNRHFHVDHCHETGATRGLLCQRCNTGLGLLGDNLSGLMQAVRYLHTANINEANAA